MPYNQSERSPNAKSNDYKTRQVLNIAFVLMAAGILFGGFVIDWFISFFFGPIGCTIAIPSALAIAIFPLLFKRNLAAWVTAFCVVLCCAAAYMATAYLLYCRHAGSYSDWLKTIYQYWIGLVEMFGEHIWKTIFGK